MSPNNDAKRTPPAASSEPEFDRQAYLKEVRMEILRNLGLPEDTKPEQVMHLLEIKERLRRMN